MKKSYGRWPFDKDKKEKQKKERPEESDIDKIKNDIDILLQDPKFTKKPFLAEEDRIQVQNKLISVFFEDTKAIPELKKIIKQKI